MTKPLDRHIIQQLLAQPNAPSLVSEANAILEKERKRRLKFYEEITDEEKVEFINGEIVIHSPVMKEHNDANSLLHRLISVFVDKHQLGYVGIEKVMITLERNDYEPDICFFKKEKALNFKTGQSLFPAPDLVVEILSKGTAKTDRNIKFNDYEANGVLEYIIIDPKKQNIELYRLNASKKYELILKSGEGTLQSKAIKGFSIDILAIFDKNLNLKQLSKLLA